MQDTLDAITDQAEFDRQVLRSPLPVAVNFYTPWCPRCQRFALVFESLAQEFAGQIRFVRVDVDAAPQLDMDWRIEAVPTVILLDAGRVARRWADEQRHGQLRQGLREFLLERPRRGIA